MKPLSFRLRIALLSVLVSGSVLAGFGLASWYAFHRQRIEAVDTEIRSLGTRHPGWLVRGGNYERLTSSLEFIFGREHENQVILLVKNAAGQTLYTSPSWPKELNPAGIDCALEDDPKAATLSSVNTNAPLGPGWGAGGGSGRGGMGRGGSPVVFTKTPRFFTVTTPASAWRFGVMGNNELRLVVGLNFDAAQADLNRMRRLYLLTLTAALLLIGCGGWWVSGRALRPLKNIAHTAERVTAQGLDQRIPASQEDPEIARLISVLNGMMDRLEASFRQATRFSADASHELKTPLTVMQGELENALQAAAPGSREQQVFTNLLEETQRLKTITRGLLLLAQADAGQLKLAPEDIDLGAMIEAMIEDARILAGDADLSFQTKLAPGVRVQGDRILLHTALFNLLSNAVKYNETGGRVSVEMTAIAGPVTVTVGNTGPGIPEVEQPKLFGRFHRGDRTRGQPVEGMGLGLSLAREIARAHRGELVLSESRPGWTCFTLTLKSAPTP